eukprot:TRINITY_DN30059_c0_g1_i1.p1 TRINITY_DN30059_c0_g1~~TRINITY_DN30059_c0_g1_i1.p1  ORF type:complete len:465 (+),score=94.26 TRINITY_DN30059_c0_g1_i1:111-1505(+)
MAARWCVERLPVRKTQRAPRAGYLNDCVEALAEVRVEQGLPSATRTWRPQRSPTRSRPPTKPEQEGPDPAVDGEAARRLMHCTKVLLRGVRDRDSAARVRGEVMRIVADWYDAAAGTIDGKGYEAVLKVLATVGAGRAAAQVFDAFEQRVPQLACSTGQRRRVYLALLVGENFSTADTPFLLRVEQAMVASGYRHSRDSLSHFLVRLAKGDARGELSPRRAVLREAFGKSLDEGAYVALIASAPTFSEARALHAHMAQKNMHLGTGVYSTLLAVAAKLQPKRAGHLAEEVHRSMSNAGDGVPPVNVVNNTLYCYLVAGEHAKLVAYFEHTLAAGAPLTFRSHSYVIRSHAQKVEAVRDHHFRCAEAAFKRAWGMHRSGCVGGQPVHLYLPLLDIYRATAALRAALKLANFMAQENVPATTAVQKLITATYAAAGHAPPEGAAWRDASHEGRSQTLDGLCAALLA